MTCGVWCLAIGSRTALMYKAQSVHRPRKGMGVTAFFLGGTRPARLAHTWLASDPMVADALRGGVCRLE
jgi:hypothetical protein